MTARYLKRLGCGLLPAVVSGGSMQPTLHDGDYVLVLRNGAVRPGDLVAVRDPRLPARTVVKRVARRSTGGWEVLGDNPAASTDSRVFGPVPDGLVIGRVLLRYWPRLRLFARCRSARSDHRIRGRSIAPRLIRHFRSTSP